MLKSNRNCYNLFDETAYHDMSLSFILERKFLYKNVNDFVKLKNITLSFNTLNQNTLLYNGLIANFFFLRILTDKTPFFLPVKIISTFKHKSYSFCCQIRLSKTRSFNFLLRDLSFASNNVSVNDFGFYKHKITSHSFTLFVKNFPYMRIVETHPLFFKWNECLDVIINLRKDYNLNEIDSFLKLSKFNREELSLSK